MLQFNGRTSEEDRTDTIDWKAEAFRLRAELEEQGRQLLKIKESTSDCLFELNRQWRFTFLNKRAQREIASGRQLIGEHVLAAFPELAGSAFWKRFSSVMFTRQPSSADGFFPTLNAWCQVQVTPTADGLLACFGNISDIKQQEQTLEARRQHFQGILDSVPQITWTALPDGSCNYISRRWYEFTGQQQCGDLDNVWVEPVHPDDRDAAVSAWKQASASPASFQSKFRLRSASGEYRWMLAHATPDQDQHGTLLGWHGTCTDIHDRVTAEEKLNSSQAHFRSVLDTLPTMVWSARPDGRHDYSNQQWHDFTGVPIGDTQNAGVWSELLHPEDIPVVMAAWKHSLATGEPYEALYRLRHRSGEYYWVSSGGRPERDSGGRITRWHGTCTEIHDHVLAQQALKASEALNRGIIETSPDKISILDAQGIVLHVNKATLSLYGLEDPSLLLGRPWAHRLKATNQAAAKQALASAQAGGIGRVTLQGQSAEGEVALDVVLAPIDGGGGKAKFVVISRDITHQKAAEEQAHWTASHDNLTGLPNRALFQARLDAMIRDAGCTGNGFAVLLFDLDDFKRTNDTLGHDAGDALLQAFADRLQNASRSSDTVARLGGDEFAILLPGIADAARIEKTIDRIAEELKAPCVHDGKLLDLHASIGASLHPQDGRTRIELLKHADLALYSAKTTARGKARIFEPAMRAESQRRSSMLNLARQALDKELIIPFYQPKVSLETGRIEGFEALLRWRHPTRGIQLPQTVAAAFQDLNLAARISDRMIHRVICDIKAWSDRGLPFGHVAVNASAAEFRVGDFAERLLERLHREGLPASAMQLEVTETVFLGRGAEYVDQALKTLSRAGMQIALDDFGTGYASLSHLKQFPVNVLKIDRSFVRDIHTDPEDAAIVGAVINLGHSLGIKVVAEGVETMHQHDFLVASGCSTGQGFLYGKAAPAREVGRIVRRPLVKAGDRPHLCRKRSALPPTSAGAN